MPSDHPSTTFLKTPRRSFLTAGGTAAVAGACAALSTPSALAATRDQTSIKILGICCSPRKGQGTASALRSCLDAAKAVDPRISVELIELAGLKIPGQVAAGIPLEPGERDDFPPLVPKLLDTAVAGIILGTPVYFGNMSYLCKAFLDRCIVVHKNKSLSNKVGGVVAVGGARNGGLELTVRSVQAALMSQQMIVVGDAPPTGHWGGTVWAGAGPEGGQDTLGLSTAKNLGRRVAEVALLLAASGNFRTRNG